MRLVASLALSSCLALCCPALARADGLGTANPVRILAVSPDARWAALCEARKDTDRDGRIAVKRGTNGLYGDQMAAFLVLGSGPGVALDDLVEHDPTGRHVVILRTGKLILVDTKATAPAPAGEVDMSALGAYARPRRDPSGAYLGVSFDAAGKRLSYVALRKKQPVVMVRDLAAGTEVTVEIGPGKLWSAVLDPTGTRVLVEVVAVDTDRNKQLTFPTFRWPGSEWRPRCETRAVGDVIKRTGDQPSMRLAPATGGVATDAPGYIGLLGDAVLRREDTRALVLVDATGPHELLPAACKGVIHRVDPVGRRVLAHCAGKGDDALRLVAMGVNKDLGLPAGNPETDSLATFGRHLLTTTRDADDTIVDLETGDRRTVEWNQRELEVLGGRTLVSRHGRLVLLDGASETDLGAISGEYPEVLEAGTIRYIAPLVVDLGKGTVLGVAPERDGQPPSILAVAADGRLLGTYHVNPGGLPSGPVEWLTPVAAR